MDAFAAAIAESAGLEAPEPVVAVAERKRGVAPKLSVEALELARQVYYLQHGTRPDAARAIVAAGLADTDDTGIVSDRLQTWWERERWPQRSRLADQAIRDAARDGLCRGDRQCQGRTTGNGAALGGEPCGLTAMDQSDFCMGHDPRPEFVAKRREHGLRLARAREADGVPRAPFVQWCHERRVELLAEARGRGDRVDPKDKGWGRLAHELDVDASVLTKLIKGTHSGAREREGKGPSDTVRASTIERYLEHAGVNFRDVYGFDAPSFRVEHRCACGKRKNAASTLCMSCYEETLGAPCVYIDRRGERCPRVTRHSSSHCGVHRQMIQRQANPKPRNGKQSALSTPMLVLALGEYRTSRERPGSRGACGPSRRRLP